MVQCVYMFKLSAYPSNTMEPICVIIDPPPFHGVGGVEFYFAKPPPNSLLRRMQNAKPPPYPRPKIKHVC